MSQDPDTLVTTPAHGFPEEDLRVDGENNSGYFPARLGMSLKENGPYIIVRKLGWGQASSVWLARDIALERFVSIKIMTCEATRAIKAGKADELAMLQKISTTDRSHPGSGHVVEYYETFDLEGPHGMHCCIVTEPLGFSLQFTRSLQLSQGERMAPEDIADTIRHVLLALDYLHNSCGIIHTDVKFDNILYRPDDLTACIAHVLLTIPSETYRCDLRARPVAVPIVSQPITMYSPETDIQKARVQAVITDFSHSHWANHRFQDEIQSYALRAPEVILGYEWNGAADVWSVGCLAAEMLTDHWLFQPRSEPGWDRDEDHLARMTELLGEQFPLDMLEKCKHRSKYLKEDGSFAHFTHHEEPMLDLCNLLQQRSYLMQSSPHEVEGAPKFLKRCLKLRPEDRESPAELAQDAWLVQERHPL
ncbi:unnamed protein product [Rhizoctonia solani]|nr:unnamed protein product [Rhizoctonia solani]